MSIPRSPIPQLIYAASSLREALHLVTEVAPTDPTRQDLMEFVEDVGDYIDAIRMALAVPARTDSVRGATRPQLSRAAKHGTTTLDRLRTPAVGRGQS